MKHFDSSNFRREFLTRSKDGAQKLREQQDQQAERDKKAKKADAAENDLIDLIVSVVLATSEQVTAFQSRLNRLEEQATERILVLQAQLDQQMAERKVLLDAAYITPDGQKVFRSEDGQRFYDEDGQLLDSEALDLTGLTPQHTTADRFLSHEDAIAHTTEQIEEAIQFRDQVNDLQDKAGADGLSQSELNDLEAKLDDILPESFREQPELNTGIPAQQKPGFPEIDQKDLDRLEDLTALLPPNGM